MKIVRKFLAIIISVIMTLLSFSVLASGAQIVSYSANDVAGKKGETVAVKKATAFAHKHLPLGLCTGCTKMNKSQLIFSRSLQIYKNPFNKFY